MVFSWQRRASSSCQRRQASPARASSSCRSSLRGAQIGRLGPSRDHPVAAHSPILPSGCSSVREPHTPRDQKASRSFSTRRAASGVESRNLSSHCCMFHKFMKSRPRESDQTLAWLFPEIKVFLSLGPARSILCQRKDRNKILVQLSLKERKSS